MVSFWAKDGTVTVSNTISSKDAVYTNANGWKYYEKVISGSPITISGSAKIDELRFYPLESQMSTYTYKPGVGPISETPPNGITTKYEYDAFNRLTAIKDMDGNVIKYFTYDYQVTTPSTQQN